MHETRQLNVRGYRDGASDLTRMESGAVHFPPHTHTHLPSREPQQPHTPALKKSPRMTGALCQSCLLLQTMPTQRTQSIVAAATIAKLQPQGSAPEPHQSSSPPFGAHRYQLPQRRGRVSPPPSGPVLRHWCSLCHVGLIDLCSTYYVVDHLIVNIRAVR